MELVLQGKFKKGFTKPTTLHGAMHPETCFAAPFLLKFQLKVSTCNSGLTPLTSEANLYNFQKAPLEDS